jgi:hypothetical protein
MQTTNIVLGSPNLPTGVTFAINCMLELGIYAASRSKGDWLHSIDGTLKVRPENRRLMSQYLPYFLDESRQHTFIPGKKLLIDHLWPSPLYEDEPVILWTRDVRDVCFSNFKAFSSYWPTLDFETSLLSPIQPFQLTAQDTWTLYYRLWLAIVKKDKCKVVSFEDSKTEPVQVFREIIAFIGLDSDARTIEAAVGNSSVQRAKLASEQFAATEQQDPFTLKRVAKSLIKFFLFKGRKSPSMINKGEARKGVEAFNDKLKQQTLGEPVYRISKVLGYALRSNEALQTDSSAALYKKVLGDIDALGTDTGNKCAFIMRAFVDGSDTTEVEAMLRNYLRTHVSVSPEPQEMALVDPLRTSRLLLASIKGVASLPGMNGDQLKWGTEDASALTLAFFEVMYGSKATEVTDRAANLLVFGSRAQNMARTLQRIELALDWHGQKRSLSRFFQFLMHKRKL